MLGRVVRIDGVPTPIVGVMPERFAFPNTPAVWLPLWLDAVAPRDDRNTVNAFGRLARGATIASATTELEVVREIVFLYPFGVRARMRPEEIEGPIDATSPTLSNLHNLGELT